MATVERYSFERTRPEERDGAHVLLMRGSVNAVEFRRYHLTPDRLEVVAIKRYGTANEEKTITVIRGTATAELKNFLNEEI